MKILAVLKYQQFEDNRSDKTKLKDSKCQRLDAYDNKEGENLDKLEGKDKGEGEDIGYTPLPFIALLQKESNRLTDISEGINSLNHLVYILKIG